LIGDAAHLAVPFTSAGTTMLSTLKYLNKTLMNSSSIEQALIPIIKNASDLTNHLEQGRLLKNNLLEPEKHSERGYILPW
jgi:hypothetical protein